jgi:hypothetical protein
MAWGKGYTSPATGWQAPKVPRERASAFVTPLTGSQTTAQYKAGLTSAFAPIAARLLGGHQGAAAPAAAAPAPPAAAPDPRDSTFNTSVAGLLFNNRNQRQDLETQNGQQAEDFNTMLARMADNRAQDLLAQNYAANKQGLFYSGQLGKRRDTVEKGYDQQKQDAQTAYDRGVQARAEALNRLGTITEDPNTAIGLSGTGEAGLSLADFLNQAVGRQAQQDAGGGGDTAASAQVGPAAAPAAPAAASSGDVVIRPSASHGGAKWVYRVGSTGKLIPIRPA